MELLNKNIFVVGICFCLSACGVKGLPLPPLKPAPIGRGEPTYSEATQKNSGKKKDLKNSGADEDNSRSNPSPTSENRGD